MANIKNVALENVDLDLYLALNDDYYSYISITNKNSEFIERDPNTDDKLGLHIDLITKIINSLVLTRANLLLSGYKNIATYDSYSNDANPRFIP